jgi:fumarate hydratase class II
VVNHALGLQDEKKTQAIVAAADEVIAGKHPGEFPLVVWQTGSGTQTNMNVNEVLANRASEILGGERGEGPPGAPERRRQPQPVVQRRVPHRHARGRGGGHHAQAAARHRQAARHAGEKKARDFADIVKIGRTHLQDATPLTLGQEFSGYVAQLAHGDRARARRAAAPERTGAGRHRRRHRPERAQGLCGAGGGRTGALTGLPFVTAPTSSRPWPAVDALVHAHGALKTLAASMMKIANDVRWLASGPRSGIGELSIPENEPGSSIMPGKVNPTQSEAVTMLAARCSATTWPSTSAAPRATSS